MSKPSNPFLFIGKPVTDEYGRQIGQVASFLVSPNGRVNAVLLEHGDGEFFSYPSEQFRIDGDSIVILQQVKLKVKALCDEIPLIWRKDQVLSGLSGKKDVPSELLSFVHKNFEGALDQLKADAQATIDKIDKQTAKCTQQIRDLNTALINLEIEREIGRIDADSYQTAMKIIQQGLKQANAEKSDLETMRNQLSNIILGERPITVAPKEVKEEAPQQPVVVHVKPRA